MTRKISLNFPWGNFVSLGKAVICLSLALTLLLTPASVLTAPLLGVPHESKCTGVASVLLFCIVSPEQIELAKMGAAFVLIVAGLGIFPAVFAIPAAYFAQSVFQTISLPDGGDQIAAILLLILMIHGISDWRRTCWRKPDSIVLRQRFWTTRVMVASISLFCARLQISILYFFAGVSKLSVDAWQDGSAIYMWVRHVSFGAPGWLEGVVLPLTAFAPVSSLITWSTIALEIALGISLLMPASIRLRVLLPVGLMFHAAILLILGIASFALIMIGALLIFLPDHGMFLRVRKELLVDAEESSLSSSITTAEEGDRVSS